MKGGANLNTDMSVYLSRKQRNPPEDPCQAHITDYYERVISYVDKLVRENQKLSDLLQQHLQADQFCGYELTPILKQVILNAQKNARAYPTQRRHTEVITKFAIALFIFSGPFGYEFLQRNMQQGLPTPSSVQCAIHVQYKTLDEGVFRFNDLATHIRNHSAPSIASIAEDATRVVERVEYDPETDRCVGFVLPIDQDGLLIVDSFLATSFAAINSKFENGSISKYAYVYMAQPLRCNIPPFI